MPETFLLLLAAGVMLAAAVSNPSDVTLQWLRLAGVIALPLAALSLYFYLRRDEARLSLHFLLYALSGLAVLAQLAFVQVAKRRTQRFFATLAFIFGVLLAAMMVPGSTQTTRAAPGPRAAPLLASAGSAAMAGLVLMDMLLGHAYLTASRMTIRPFLRLNRSLAAALVLRIICAAGLTMLLLNLHPIELFWDRYGILLITRWLVGLAVPALFIYMAHDCIQRRSAQSATGILYVAGLLIFIGEIIALYLVRETALPF